MIVIVDIDNTVCTQEENYLDAQPIPENIAKINKLYDEGHIIEYWTARGGTSGKHWYSDTLKQLVDWGCKFNTLLMNKPSYDIFIDDKAKRIEEL